MKTASCVIWRHIPGSFSSNYFAWHIFNQSESLHVLESREQAPLPICTWRRGESFAAKLLMLDNVPVQAHCVARAWLFGRQFQSIQSSQPSLPTELWFCHHRRRLTPTSTMNIHNAIDDNITTSFSACETLSLPRAPFWQAETSCSWNCLHCFQTSVRRRGRH